MGDFVSKIKKKREERKREKENNRKLGEKIGYCRNFKILDTVPP